MATVLELGVLALEIPAMRKQYDATGHGTDPHNHSDANK